MTDIDFDARYRVKSMPGVAWWIESYVEEFKEVEWTEEDEDGETLYCYDVEVSDNTSLVNAIMVGDDRRHVIDVDDLVKIGDDDYCSGCGQIGCRHGA
jgi:hypothetical protein